MNFDLWINHEAGHPAPGKIGGKRQSYWPGAGDKYRTIHSGFKPSTLTTLPMLSTSLLI